MGLLIVVIGAGYAAYQHRDIFGITSSAVEIRPLASTKDYMMFLVENSGNRSASIGSVTGEFQFVGSAGTNQSAPLRLDPWEYEKKGETSIPPGLNQTIKVHFAEKKRLETLRKYLFDVGEIKNTRCIFRFEVVNHDGSQINKELDFDCRQYVAEYFQMRNKATLSIPIPSRK